MEREEVSITIKRLNDGVPYISKKYRIYLHDKSLQLYKVEKVTNNYGTKKSWINKQAVISLLGRV